MLDYQNGKIYTIRYKKDSSLIYVGSTCLPLWVRFSIHKNVCYNPNAKSYNELSPCNLLCVISTTDIDLTS